MKEGLVMNESNNIETIENENIITNYKMFLERKQKKEKRNKLKEKLVESLLIKTYSKIFSLTPQQKIDFAINKLKDDDKLIEISHQFVKQKLKIQDKVPKSLAEEYENEILLIHEALIEVFQIIRDEALNEIEQNHGELLIEKVLKK